jgi:hypothetical protein
MVFLLSSGLLISVDFSISRFIRHLRHVGEVFCYCWWKIYMVAKILEVASVYINNKQNHGDNYYQDSIGFLNLTLNKTQIQIHASQ